MARSMKQHQGGRWLIYDGQYYRRLEELNEVDLRAGVAYLSGSDLNEELEYTTEQSKYRATNQQWKEAMEMARVADFLEEYIANGGDRHG
jgi:hypothetical protein